MDQSHPVHERFHTYRYEFLMAALLLLIFDKIFVPDNGVYLQWVWPFTMLLMSLACFGIFQQHNRHLRFLRNLFSAISLAMPFGFMAFSSSPAFVLVLTLFFIVYYSFIFIVVMRQMIRIREIRINVIIGSFCGYLLLSMVALFTYLLVVQRFPGSFHGIDTKDMGAIYNQLSYFSFITLTSIGFGDIYPVHDTARLVTAFFGMLGQFYMVAVVGIIISRFSSK